MNGIYPAHQSPTEKAKTNIAPFRAQTGSQPIVYIDPPPFYIISSLGEKQMIFNEMLMQNQVPIHLNDILVTGTRNTFIAGLSQLKAVIFLPNMYQRNR